MKRVKLLKTRSGVNSFMHLKCFLGQLLFPMCEQGLQVNELFSKIKFLVPYGMKPNSLIVEPKIANTGTLTAHAVCIKPESLQTIALHSFMSAAVCRISFSLHKLMQPGRLEEISSQICLSSLPPKITMLNLFSPNLFPSWM